MSGGRQCAARVSEVLSGPNRPAHRLHQDPAIRTRGWGNPTPPERQLFPSQPGVAQSSIFALYVFYSSLRPEIQHSVTTPGKPFWHPSQKIFLIQTLAVKIRKHIFSV